MFARVHAGWALFEVLSVAQMNQMDIDHANAVDGANGGIYAPTASITIGGLGLVVTGSFTASANATFNGTSVFSGIASFQGDTTFAAGHTMTVGGPLHAIGNETHDGGALFNDAVTVDDALNVTGLTTLASLQAQAIAGTTGPNALNGSSVFTGPVTTQSTVNANGELVLGAGGRIREKVRYLADADATIDLASGTRMVMKDGVSTAQRTLTLSNTGASTGSILEVESFEQNSGRRPKIASVAASVFHTMAVAVIGFGGQVTPAVCRFLFVSDGATERWILLEEVTP